MDTPNTYWPIGLDHVHPYAHWSNAFSVEECDLIVKTGLSKTLADGKTMGTENIRKSSVSWIHPHAETNWIFEKLNHIVTNINDQFFKFNIHGMAEGLQFSKYEEPDNRYGKHVDRQFGMVTRKLSISVQLSDPESYVGGEFLLFNEESPIVLPNSQGTVIIFPSYALHEVRQVISGSRYSLVSWVNGAPFQ
jgi:PKHD-type hydroxylase